MSVLLIAEIGINHNGSVDTAFKLIDAAKQCGFDAVKFQKRNPELYNETPYISPFLGVCTYREHKRFLELSEADYERIHGYCASVGIEWSASCFDCESVDFVSQFKPAYWKIASPCILDLDLVEHVGKQRGFVIMSTGMSTMEEVDDAFDVLENQCDKEHDEMALLHCCSEYPTPPERVNLFVMDTLRDRYRCSIGYSAHDAGVTIPAAAVARGAEIVEVHITLNRTLPGSDHAASLEFAGMRTLVNRIRDIEKALGVSEKQFYEGERKIREKVQQVRRNGV